MLEDREWLAVFTLMMLSWMGWISLSLISSRSRLGSLENTKRDKKDTTPHGDYRSYLEEKFRSVEGKVSAVDDRLRRIELKLNHVGDE